VREVEEKGEEKGQENEEARGKKKWEETNPYNKLISVNCPL